MKKILHIAKTIFNSFSIQKKLILIYAAACIFPVLFITFYSIHGMVSIFNEKSYVENQAQCNQIAANIETQLNDFYKSVLNFSNSTVTNNYFEYEYPNNSAFFSEYPKVSLHISSFLASNSQISRLTVYTDNPTFIINNNSIKRLTNTKLEEFQKLQESYYQPPIIPVTATYSKNGLYLNLYRKLTYTKNTKYHSLLEIAYPEDILYMYYHQHESASFKLYLVSPAGQIISSSDRTLLGKKKDAADAITLIENNGITAATLTQSGQSHYYFNDFSDSTLLEGWNIYIELSDKSYLQNIFHLISRVLLIIFALLLMGLLLYYLCSRSITRRLNRLITTMSGIRDDETLKVVTETGAKDEIGILTQSFQMMIERIKSLINDVYLSDLQVKNLEIKNKQAQLFALQSQINPHFLFNTMQSLTISCYNNDDYETAAYLNKFCSFLRDCLYWENKCVPLSEELRMVENYLGLQKLRYQDQLEYTIHIPDNLKEIPIPKFTLQPLIENAVEHGLENQEQPDHVGIIHINAFACQKQTYITIEDNGIGIPPDKLRELNQQLKKCDGNSHVDSIGIFNTNERLKLFYGPDFGLSLESEQYSGTKVILTICVSDKAF